MINTPKQFATEPRRQLINWPKRVAAHLDSIADPAFSPADDWEIVQALALGVPVPRKPGYQTRAFRLIDATRNGYGIFTLDGRTALIAEAKARA